MIIFVLFLGFALGYCVGNDKLRSLLTGKSKVKLVANEKKETK